MDEARDVVAPEWVAWATENLLAGASIAKVRAAWLEEGVPEALADATLEALRRSPIFEGARRLAARERRLAQVVRLARERSRTLTIESREGLDAETFFGTYVAGNVPVLLPDFAREWPAVRRWSLDDLETRFGDATIAVSEGRASLPVHERNSGRSSQETSMRALIARIRDAGESDDFYAIAQDRNLARPELSALLDDVDLSRGFLDGEKLRFGTALWLGPAGTVTPLHHDTSSILFVQVVGRKRVTLIAPNELSMFDRAHAMYAAVEPEEIADDVRVHELELGPGDTLFLPVGWWHHVRALTPSISLAFNALSRGPNAFVWYGPGSIR
ncbi:MAG: cupin-like domain-containing protein [Sandaracinus sp.]|nr:cupin-like domain-containing protein [Sandaracinus sp.]